MSLTFPQLVESLDLSDCQLDDEALGRYFIVRDLSSNKTSRLAPVFGHVSELNLSDNNFTWYVAYTMFQPSMLCLQVRDQEAIRGPQKVKADEEA